MTYSTEFNHFKICAIKSKFWVTGTFVEKSMIPEGTNMGSKHWLTFSSLALEIPSATDASVAGESKVSSTETSDGSIHEIVLNLVQM